jgi:hypothetical protein
MRKAGERASTDGRGNERSLPVDRMRDQEYLKQGSLEQKVRALIVDQGKWIKDYMKWLYSDVDHLPR